MIATAFCIVVQNKQDSREPARILPKEKPRNFAGRADNAVAGQQQGQRRESTPPLKSQQEESNESRVRKLILLIRAVSCGGEITLTW